MHSGMIFVDTDLEKHYQPAATPPQDAHSPLLQTGDSFTAKPPDQKETWGAAQYGGPPAAGTGSASRLPPTESARRPSEPSAHAGPPPTDKGHNASYPSWQDHKRKHVYLSKTQDLILRLVFASFCFALVLTCMSIGADTWVFPHSKGLYNNGTALSAGDMHLTEYSLSLWGSISCSLCPPSSAARYVGAAAAAAADAYDCRDRLSEVEDGYEAAGALLICGSVALVTCLCIITRIGHFFFRYEAEAPGTLGTREGHRALCPRCARCTKSPLFWTRFPQWPK